MSEALTRSARRLAKVAEDFKPGMDSDGRSRKLLFAMQVICDQAALVGAPQHEVTSEILAAAAHAVAILIQEAGAHACGQADCHCQEGALVVDGFTAVLGGFLGLKTRAGAAVPKPVFGTSPPADDDLSPVAEMRRANAAKIAAGVDKPGTEGAFYRLLALCEPNELVNRFGDAEMARNADSNDATFAMGEFIGLLMAGWALRTTDVKSSFHRLALSAQLKAIGMFTGADPTIAVQMTDAGHQREVALDQLAREARK